MLSRTLSTTCYRNQLLEFYRRPHSAVRAMSDVNPNKQIRVQNVVIRIAVKFTTEYRWHNCITELHLVLSNRFGKWTRSAWTEIDNSFEKVKITTGASTTLYNTVISGCRISSMPSEQNQRNTVSNVVVSLFWTRTPPHTNWSATWRRGVSSECTSTWLCALGARWLTRWACVCQHFSFSVSIYVLAHSVLLFVFVRTCECIPLRLRRAPHTELWVYFRSIIHIEYKWFYGDNATISFYGFFLRGVLMLLLPFDSVQRLAMVSAERFNVFAQNIWYVLSNCT